jgi:hypothetical protein
VKQIQKQWLASVPWQSVLSINQALCQAQKTEHKPTAAGYVAAQKAWEAASPKQMTLPEVLDVCKKCHDLSPFVFNNGNTFAAIAKTLIEDGLQNVAPLEAQIIRATVAHYVAGLVGKRELIKILDHFEPFLKSAGPSKTSVPPLSSSAPPAKPGNAPPIQTVQPSH